MLAVAALPEVDLATPVIGNQLTVQYGNASRDIYVYSSNEQLPGIHHWPLALGRFFNAAEDESLAPVVVLGHKARKQFFRDEPNPLGRQLLIGDAPFEVIGVMAEKGKESGADYYDEMVFIPTRPAERGSIRTFSSLSTPRSRRSPPARSTPLAKRCASCCWRVMAARISPSTTPPPRSRPKPIPRTA